MATMKIMANRPAAGSVRCRCHDQSGPSAQARRLCQLAANLTILLLLIGCQSGAGSKTDGAFLTPGPNDAATVSLSATISRTVSESGFSSTDLVLVTVLTLPRPDRETESNAVWRGVFAGSEKALLHAADRILVIARSRDTHQFGFNATLQSWWDFSDGRKSNWEKVWFNGTAREFFCAIRSDRAERAPILASVSTTPPEVVLPLQVTADVLRSDLVQLGLHAMKGQFRAERAAGRLCTPEIFVYMQLAPEPPDTHGGPVLSGASPSH